MTISANTIFHFTSSENSLMGILELGFKVHLCRETIRLIDKESTRYIPMVSFCDIPLAQVKDHMDKYGTYGIGMTKEWALRNGLSPVSYFASKSNASTSFSSAYYEVIRQPNLDGDESIIRDSMRDVIRYIKNYEGPLYRKGKKGKDSYRFYDEREWRYVPTKKLFNRMFLLPKNYENHLIRAQEQHKLSKIILSFDADDVKYIILRDESKIHKFIRHLQEVKGNKYPQHTVELILTRILTRDQIQNDF